jgi:uncharacterized protein (DUF433 family)
LTSGFTSLIQSGKAAFPLAFQKLNGYNLFMPKLERITWNPAVMGGKPCIRGLRVTVGTIVGLVAASKGRDEILRLYPYLEGADIDEAMAYATWRVEEQEVAVAGS